VSGNSLSISSIRFDVLLLLRTGPLAGWVVYSAFAVANRDGKAALRIGRSIGAQLFAMASAGSVTLQKAAQIMEYGRSVKSTAVRTLMRMIVMEEILFN
jgi:hypothetical protein